MNFTKGPWISGHAGSTMKGYSQPFGIVQYGKSNLIAGVFGDVEGGESKASGNAALIAQAPELLRIVELAVENHCSNPKVFCGSCTEARRIIAQAKEGGK